MNAMKKSLTSVAIAGALLGLGATEALATHARFGTISWVALNPAQPNVVTFRVETAWRRSFYGAPGPNLGDPVALGGTFLFGDGLGVPLDATVTAINPVEDWFTAVFITTHTYPAATGNFVAEANTCCRISTLLEANNDQSWIIRTVVGIDMGSPNRSPVSSSLPIITLQRGVPNTFAIPAADPDGEPLSFRFATGAESGLVTSPPTGMAMTPAGVITWTPTISGLYAMQVIISDTRGATIPLDVILNVVTAAGTAPTVTINGSPTPVTFLVSPGTLVAFTVAGTDPDIDPATGLPNTLLTMSSGSRPASSTMSPALPFTARSPIASVFSWTPVVADGGAHVIVFSVTDNTGLQRQNSVTIDVEKNQAPTITCPANAVEEAQSAAGRDLTLSVTVADPNPTDTLSVTYRLDGGASIPWWTVGPIGTTPQSHSDVFSFGLGPHTLSFTVSDGAAAPATCSSSVTIVDTTPPVVTLPADVTLEATGPGGTVHTFTASAVDLVDGTVPVTCTPASGSLFPLGSTLVTCSASDAAGNSAGGAFRINVVDTTPPVLTLPPDTTLDATGPAGAVYTFTAFALDIVDGPVAVTCLPPSGSTFALGSTTVTCSATDAAGNTASGSFAVLVLDMTPPVLTLPPDVTLEATGPGGASHTFTASAVDLVNGPVPVTCAPTSGSIFPLGPTTITCQASDAFGNTANGSFTVTVVDTTPPVLTLPPPVTLEATGPSGALHTFTASAVDLVDGPGLLVTCTPASGSTFSLGVTTVACSATDAAGNMSNGSFGVTVMDTTPPALTLPSNATLEATGPVGAVHTYTASALDIVDGPLTVLCTPASGSSFALGLTTTACSVADAAGNAASGSFTVTVVDTTPPALTLPPNVTREATGPAGAAYTFTASAVDLVSGVVPVSCAPASGSTFSLGVTTVACSATDAAGNSAAGSFTVAVVDTTPPALTLPPNTVLEATGPLGRVFTFTASAVDQVSGPRPVACTPASGFRFPLGVTVVACSASDAAGNTATGTFTVTVRDTKPPVISCVSASPGKLWPPNHKMVTVKVKLTVKDNMDPSPSCAVTSVSSNEPISGTGPGDLAPDWELLGGLKVKLRAERKGNGPGRVYTLTVGCTDDSGNTSTSTVKVNVKHDQGH
jgi:hypothetical protein